MNDKFDSSESELSDVMLTARQSQMRRLHSRLKDDRANLVVWVVLNLFVVTFIESYRVPVWAVAAAALTVFLAGVLLWTYRDYRWYRQDHNHVVGRFETEDEVYRYDARHEKLARRVRLSLTVMIFCMVMLVALGVAQTGTIPGLVDDGGFILAVAGVPVFGAIALIQRRKLKRFVRG